MDSADSTSGDDSASCPRERAVRLVAALTVVGCALIPLAWRQLGSEWNAAAVTLVGLVAILLLREGNVEGLGFQSRPRQGWTTWCRVTLWAGLGIGVAVGAFVGLSLVMDWPLSIPRVPPYAVFQHLLFLCLLAPVVEELLYRSLLTLAVRPTVGETGTILTSGLVFAAVHHLAGNASPENQIAGFLFAWAYLRSNTVLVPIAMHAAGNAVAALSHFANWYLFPP